MIWTIDTDTATEKVWFNSAKTYRITWRSKFMGVSVTPKYVGCFQYENGGKMCWDLVSRHNKLAPAQAACDKHYRKVQREAKKAIKDPPKKKRQRRTVKRGSTIGHGLL